MNRWERIAWAAIRAARLEHCATEVRGGYTASGKPVVRQVGAANGHARIVRGRVSIRVEPSDQPAELAARLEEALGHLLPEPKTSSLDDQQSSSV